MPTACRSADGNALRAAGAAIRLRAHALRAVRAFFDARDYVEVSTPLVVATPAIEDHIDAVPAGGGYLRTSPELHMKRLLAAGIPRVYQVGPCFRAGERGRLHHPEFTMLEWYCAGAGYREVLAETRELVVQVARTVLGTSVLSRGEDSLDLAADWEFRTVRESFLAFAGWDPVAAWDADRFDFDLVGRVEPALSRRRAVVLADYPAPAAALARRKPDDPAVAERWELYLAGIEIANAYGELTDAAEQRARFLASASGRKVRGQPDYPLDEAFLAALESGLPACAGVALGLDRLLLLLAGCDTLDAVLPFRADGWPGIPD